MARSPEIKNKTNRLVFIPLSQEEHHLSETFKKLVAQDETTIHDLLLEGINLCLTKHHIVIGGNPNRQLLSFNPDAPQSYPKCKCGKTSVHHGLHLASNLEYDYCEQCFRDVICRHDVKVWSWKT